MISLSLIFQGIELDWQWPLDSGDKKDKIKLIRYIRVSFIFTGLSTATTADAFNFFVIPSVLQIITKYLHIFDV